MYEKNDYIDIELNSVRSMIYIPENVIEIEMNIKVFEDSKIIEVKRTLNLQEIRKAIKKAEDGYVDEDDRFVITEEGRRFLEDRYGIF